MSGTINCAAPHPGARTPLTLIGVPPATLMAWRSAAQAALQTLYTGQSIVQIDYAEGQGRRHVQYKTADVANLTAWISQLNQALGLRTRRPIGIGFR